MKTIRRKKKAEYYLEPEELRESVKEMKELGHMTERFAKHLLTIQEKVLEFRRFVCYRDTLKDEMRSYNLYRWAKRGWQMIDADKNCFAYITTACQLNFLRALADYYKEEQRREALEKEILELAGKEWIETAWQEMDRIEREEDEEI